MLKKDIGVLGRRVHCMIVSFMEIVLAAAERSWIKADLNRAF